MGVHLKASPWQNMCENAAEQPTNLALHDVLSSLCPRPTLPIPYPHTEAALNHLQNYVWSDQSSLKPLRWLPTSLQITMAYSGVTCPSSTCGHRPTSLLSSLTLHQEYWPSSCHSNRRGYSKAYGDKLTIFPSLILQSIVSGKNVI